MRARSVVLTSSPRSRHLPRPRQGAHREPRRLRPPLRVNPSRAVQISLPPAHLLFHFRSLAVSIPTVHGRHSSPLLSPAFFSSGSKPRALHCLYTMSSSATRAKTQSQPCAMTGDESGRLTLTASWNIAVTNAQNQPPTGEHQFSENGHHDLRKPTRPARAPALSSCRSACRHLAQTATTPAIASGTSTCSSPSPGSSPRTPPFAQHSRAPLSAPSQPPAPRPRHSMH